MKRNTLPSLVAKFAAILFITLTFASCTDGTEFKFMNESSDTYRITFDNDVEDVPPGETVTKYTDAGKHYWKYEQRSGFRFYPTIKEDTVTLDKGKSYGELIQ